MFALWGALGSLTTQQLGKPCTWGGHGQSCGPLCCLLVALVTYAWGHHQTFLTGVFSFAFYIVHGTRVYNTTKEALAAAHVVIVCG